MSVGALTSRVRKNYVRGVLSQQIATAALTATSTDFTAIPEVLQGDEFAMLALDPDQVVGLPELVKITEHAAGSDTIIIERHQEDTAARLHPVATVWRLVSSADDFALIEQVTADEIANLDLALTGYLPLAGGALGGDLSLGGNDINMGGGQIVNVPIPVDGTAAVSQDHADSRYLALGGGTMAGPVVMSGHKITDLGEPVADTDASTKGYVTTYAAPVHTHPYAASAHGHPGYANEPHGSGSHTVSYAGISHVHGELSNNPHGSGNHTVAYSSASHDHNGSSPSFARVYCTDLRPTALWPHNNTASTIRWIDVNSDIAQAYSASSLDYKTDVEDVDLHKSVFSRFRPIHFQYREDYPFKERWTDWAAEARPGTGRMGVAYEDVVEVVPEWTAELQGNKGVLYEAMLPDLIADYLALRRLVLDSLGV